MKRKTYKGNIRADIWRALKEFAGVGCEDAYPHETADLLEITHEPDSENERQFEADFDATMAAFRKALNALPVPK